ncbi:MAG: hypothetical protein WA323_19970 [Candidatus Nitrosopolaris sp.]
MMNRNTAEKIAAIVLLGVLCIIFVIQNAHAMKHSKSYWLGFQARKGNCLDALHTIDDSCDVAANNPGVTNTTECIAGYLDARTLEDCQRHFDVARL